MLHHTALSLAP